MHRHIAEIKHKYFNEIFKIYAWNINTACEVPVLSKYIFKVYIQQKLVLSSVEILGSNFGIYFCKSAITV